MSIRLLSLIVSILALGCTALGYGLIALLQLSLPRVTVLVSLFIASVISLVLLLSAYTISQNTPVPKWRPKSSPVHLLVVLGSGGHTAEMLSLLRRVDIVTNKCIYRTYVVSSGDNFSATKALEFESSLGGRPESYAIITVPRARRVHQSYLTAPFTTILSFWSCILVLCGRHSDQQRYKQPAQLISPYPDLILTNGPATAVCVILAARFLRLLAYCLNFLSLAKSHRQSMTGKGASEAPLPGEFRLRTVFVESWARVKTLSLSGKILLPFADRFLVQWPALEGKQAWWGMRKTEYVAGLMD
ncbi:glycosyltransferase family protein [Aspergillus foveolatus]|uniref:glycosyltransferase family protein n=1 Tax=Aspergillus foveolatus TaxID=210207 RepID=UPI003CCDC615